VLSGKASMEGVPEKFAGTSDLLGESAASSRDPARLKAWWVFRMMFGPDPLTERLALMWHNHFSTSNLKASNPHYRNTNPWQRTPGHRRSKSSSRWYLLRRWPGVRCHGFVFL